MSFTMCAGTIIARSFAHGEAVAGGVEKPGVVVRAFHAGEESQGLARQFPSGQWASVWQGAVGLSFLVALLFPSVEVAKRRDLGRLLHPFQDLRRGEKKIG